MKGKELSMHNYFLKKDMRMFSYLLVVLSSSQRNFLNYVKENQFQSLKLFINVSEIAETNFYIEEEEKKKSEKEEKRKKKHETCLRETH